MDDQFKTPVIPQSRGESGKDTHARYRSETHIKERPTAENSFDNRKEGSTKRLPTIQFTPLMGSQQRQGAFPSSVKMIGGKKDSLSIHQSPVKGGMDDPIKHYKLGNNSFNTFRNQARSHNYTQMESHLPKLNLKQMPSVSLHVGPGELQMPTPLQCKKYQKMYSQNASPRDDQYVPQDPSQYQQNPSLRRLEQQNYKVNSFNRAVNEWNHRDETLQGASKHKYRDQLHILKEEFRIHKYQQELLSIQRKRVIIEAYQRDYKVKLPPKFNQQRCTTSHLHIKLASIYHRDRAHNAASKIQRWYRKIKGRIEQSRKYWLMLRGVFKFRWMLKKFRDRMDKIRKEFNLLINRSAVKIQKVFKGFMVRKVYGKVMAEMRIHRNYKYFYDIKQHLMLGAQCRIAFVWRMNRIKIKLARKKRERDEAAKKKNAPKKFGYNNRQNSKVTSSNALQKRNSVVSGSVSPMKASPATTPSMTQKAPAPATDKLTLNVKKVVAAQFVANSANGKTTELPKTGVAASPLNAALSAKSGDKPAASTFSQTHKAPDNPPLLQLNPSFMSESDLATVNEDGSPKNENSDSIPIIEGIQGHIDEEKSDDERDNSDDEGSQEKNDSAQDKEHAGGEPSSLKMRGDSATSSNQYKVQDESPSPRGHHDQEEEPE